MPRLMNVSVAFSADADCSEEEATDHQHIKFHFQTKFNKKEEKCTVLNVSTNMIVDSSPADGVIFRFFFLEQNS